MQRGEIYFADLDTTVGSEIKKVRPVLIVSNNANNRAATLVSIAPITSNINKIYLFDVLLEIKDSGLPKRSKAQCNQIRTISKLRLKNQKPQGIVNKKTMWKIDEALKLHLDL